jgi:hypothetical protein
MIPINSLSFEIWVEIFRSLDLRSYLHAKQVCRLFWVVGEELKVDKIFSKYIVESGVCYQIPYQLTVLSPFLQTDQCLKFTYHKDGWVVGDTFLGTPAIPRDGLLVEGVKRWVRKLLSGEECTRLMMISGVFQESFDQTYFYKLI